MKPHRFVGPLDQDHITDPKCLLLFHSSIQLGAKTSLLENIMEHNAASCSRIESVRLC